MSDIDFQIVDVENELEKRRNKSRHEILPVARPKAKISIWKMMCLFFAGLVIFRIFGELLSFIFQP